MFFVRVVVRYKVFNFQFSILNSQLCLRREVKGVDVFETVKEIVVEELAVDADEVTLEASFLDDLGADSLDIVEVVMAFEEEFDIEISDEDAEDIETVQDAVDYIEEAL